VIAQAIRVFGAIGIALAVLAIAAQVLHVEEFEELKRRTLGA
jgi:hypothetical protein